MSNEFEPYNNEGKNSEFSAWAYQGVKNEEPPEITPEELLLIECDRLKQEAIEKGYAEGMQQAQVEIEEKKTLFLQWIELIQKPVQLLDEQLTQELIQIIIWLSQHCIGIELSVNPEKLRGLLMEIKEELPSLRSNKVLSMHPLDLEWVVTQMEKKEIPGLQEILVADPSLNRGDFYLKGEHNELDGRIQSRLTTLFAKYINKDNFLTSVKSQD